MMGFSWHHLQIKTDFFVLILTIRLNNSSILGAWKRKLKIGFKLQVFENS